MCDECPVRQECREKDEIRADMGYGRINPTGQLCAMMRTRAGVPTAWTPQAAEARDRAEEPEPEPEPEDRQLTLF